MYKYQRIMNKLYELRVFGSRDALLPQPCFAGLLVKFLGIEKALMKVCIQAHWLNIELLWSTVHARQTPDSITHV